MENCEGITVMSQCSVATGALASNDSSVTSSLLGQLTSDVVPTDVELDDTSRQRLLVMTGLSQISAVHVSHLSMSVSHATV